MDNPTKIDSNINSFTNEKSLLFKKIEKAFSCFPSKLLSFLKKFKGKKL